jgi:undecaprenyl-phosphate galactose phosphotransferase
MKYFLFKFALFSLLVSANLLLAFYFSEHLISHYESHNFLNYSWQITLYLLSYYIHRLMTRRMVTANEVMIIIKSNLVALMTIFVVISLAKLGESTSRTIVLLHFILNGLNPFWTYCIKKQVMRLSFMRRPVFVVCDNQGIPNVQSWFAPGNPFGYDISAVLNVDEEPIIVVHRKIEEVIRSGRYDAAVIDIDQSGIHEVNDLIDHIQKNVHRVIILPKISKIPMLNGELISSVHHKGMAFYVKNNLLSPVDRFLKQVFDYTTALALILLFSPLLLTLYLVVFAATGGHPLFSHRRIGSGGKPFRVYKFRTMHVDAQQRLEQILESCPVSRREWEEDFKLKNDPRVTKIGKFLRSTSLDELPQLINVLRGEMSLVGPRPIIEEEIPKYGEYFEYFSAVKPGITGLWQVSGRNDIDYDERVQLDVWYVRNWSIELDLQILIKTVTVVLRREGSY